MGRAAPWRKKEGRGKDGEVRFDRCVCSLGMRGTNGAEMGTFGVDYWCDVFKGRLLYLRLNHNGSHVCLLSLELAVDTTLLFESSRFWLRICFHSPCTGLRILNALRLPSGNNPAWLQQQKDSVMAQATRRRSVTTTTSKTTDTPSKTYLTPMLASAMKNELPM